MTSRVWIVSELYYPEETSTGRLLTLLAEGLASRTEVRVLCSQPTYARLGLRGARLEMRKEVSIEGCRGTTFSKDRLILRAVNTITITLGMNWLALRRLRRGDRVLVVTNPPPLALFVLMAAQLRRARVALLVHDVYPDALVAAALVRKSAFVTRLASAASRWLYRRVARIIVIGRDMRTLVATKLAGGANRIVVIDNWADLDEISPQPRRDNALLATHQLESRFVVQYAGNMGRTHGLEALVQAAELVSESDPDVYFLFVGSGAKYVWLTEAVRSRSRSTVTVLPTQPRADLESVLNACDVAIISFIHGMSGVSVPSRMYNVMAAGKPIVAVADADSELAMVVREERIGWVVAPGDAVAIAAVIRDARNHPEEVAAMGRRTRVAAERRFGFTMALGKYAQVLDGMMDPR